MASGAQSCTAAEAEAFCQNSDVAICVPRASEVQELTTTNDRKRGRFLAECPRSRELWRNEQFARFEAITLWKVAYGLFTLGSPGTIRASVLRFAFGGICSSRQLHDPKVLMFLFQAVSGRAHHSINPEMDTKLPRPICIPQIMRVTKADVSEERVSAKGSQRCARLNPRADLRFIQLDPQAHGFQGDFRTFRL